MFRGREWYKQTTACVLIKLIKGSYIVVYSKKKDIHFLSLWTIYYHELCNVLLDERIAIAEYNQLFPDQCIVMSDEID